MSKKTLAEYVDRHGQTETSRRAGLSQGAIWQMLKAGRQIFVTEHTEEKIQLVEVKPIRRTTAA